MKNIFQCLLWACLLSTVVKVHALTLGEGTDMVCLRNVGTSTYLALNPGHRTQLSAVATSFTMTPSTGAARDSRCYVLTSLDGKLTATQFTSLLTDGEARYDEWMLTSVAVSGKTYYRLACRAKESGALAYAVYDPVSLSVQTQPNKPADTFELGLWELLSDEEARTVLQHVVLHEDVDYAHPGDADAYTVYLKRSFSEGMMNTLCLPFALTQQQAQQVWGEGTRLYELHGAGGASIVFRAIEKVEAGVPCVVKPATVSHTASLPADVAASLNNSMSEDPYYVFSDVRELVEEPQNYVQELMFVGSFGPVVVPAGSYVFSRGDVYHTTSPLTMKSYRSYMADLKQGAVAYRFEVDDDEATGIRLMEDAEVDGAMYNLSGQMVRKDGQSAAGLQRGVYVVSGKKIVK